MPKPNWNAAQWSKTYSFSTRGSEPQWCPIHENLTIKRGTNRCQRGRKRSVNCIDTSAQGVSGAGRRMGGSAYIKGEKVRISIPADRLSPMRKPHESTKRAQRS
jgi:hypothetical protein